MNDVTHEPDTQRFRDGHAYLAYRLPAQGVIEFASVQVPPERRGSGVAAALTRTAFAYASDQGLAVRPTCPYVSGTFLKRHPGFRKQVEP